MKNMTMLPLAALISGLLVGCGGGSGGGSGGGGPAKTAFTANFVKAAELNKVAAGSCKIFERQRTETQNGNSIVVETDVLTVKPVKDALDSWLSVVYTDDHGLVVENSQIQAVNGVINFFLEDIPEGGFANIVEQSGFDYYVTSFSRDFLEAHQLDLRNMMLTTVTPIPNLSCTTGTSLSEVSKSSLKYKNSMDLGNDPAVPQYYFTSNIEQERSNNFETDAQTDFQALGDDITSIAQYRTGTKEALFQYGFDDWAGAPIYMRYAGESSPITRSSINYGNVFMGIVYKNTAKTVAEITNANDSFYHPATVGSNEKWFAKTSGSPVSSWTATLSLPMDATWHLNLDDGNQLFNATTLADNNATLSNNVNKALVVDLTTNMNIDGSEQGIQRISLQPNSSAALQLHTIYSLPTEIVTVPKVTGEDISASDLTSFKLQQDFWFGASNSDIDARIMMDQFDDVALKGVSKDAHGLILEEQQRFDLASEQHKAASFSLTRIQ